MCAISKCAHVAMTLYPGPYPACLEWGTGIFESVIYLNILTIGIYENKSISVVARI